MSTTRSAFSLTTLCDGSVLTAGGHVPGGTGNTAEIYDPASGTWTITGSMGVARAEHSATLLNDCRVLVAGGSGPGGIRASAELFDPSTGTWSPANSMGQVRAKHSGFKLNDGKVLVTAGYFQGAGDSFGLSSSELYDPSTGNWTATGSLATARLNQQGVLLSDGRVLIAGGMPRGVTFSNFSSTEIYDPSSGSWSATGSMTIGRRQGFTLNLLPSGDVLVSGGTTNWTAIATDKADIYDPATQTWTPTAALSTTRTGHTATSLPNGKVLLAGGNDHPFNFGPGTVVAAAERFDPSTESWTAVGSLTGPRQAHRASSLNDARVLVAGGQAPAALSTAEIYTEFVDVKPGGDPGSVGCSSRGVIPVAVLSTVNFDATKIDADSVRFGETGTETGEAHTKKGHAKRHVELVNDDGLLDLVFHFKYDQTGFSCSDIPTGQQSILVNAMLTGNLTAAAGGTAIEGQGVLRLVGK